MRAIVGQFDISVPQCFVVLDAGVPEVACLQIQSNWPQGAGAARIAVNIVFAIKCCICLHWIHSLHRVRLRECDR